jgi:hypothetical protein
MRRFLLLSLLISPGCTDSQESRDSKAVDKQQSQYAVGQPVPAYDWSLERHLMIQLYNVRNDRVATHAVWRSNYGMIEGDCPAMGYGLPYDTSLTNPLKISRLHNGVYDVVEQPEPNGIFASKNTAATWVMCTGDAGIIEPHYVESKVTIYPGPVTVDYETNRVTRVGKSTVRISKK